MADSRTRRRAQGEDRPAAAARPVPAVAAIPGIAAAIICTAAAILCSAAALAAAPVLPVSEFDARGLRDWSARSFDGVTRYALVDVAGERVLEARADDSASGLYRELDVDLDRTPVLAWSWWVEAPVPVGDARSKGGDDFAARVYVVFSGGLAFWRTTTLVYVWADEDAPIGSWANPYTRQAMMFAVSRGTPTQDWTEVRRNVADDYRKAFGRDAPAVVAVAVMSDTDQTGARARARYRTLRFEALRPASADDRATAR
ncbi:MAG TPA: DUF3047 domain-containing protein [Pseudomonadales bacterium]|nr:DUF3047 domain-containing protein [Pseudomonadales bacterium]